MVRMGFLLAACLAAIAPDAATQDAKEAKVDPKVNAARSLARSIDSALMQNAKDDQIVGDAGFLRRAYLDLNGRIPSIAETQAFEADTSPTKRTDVIDKLIDSDDFVDLCARFWEYQWMGNYRDFRGQIGGKDVDPILKGIYPRFHRWLKHEIAEENSWNGVIGSLISAMGELKDDPAGLYKAQLFGEGEFHEYFSDRMSRAFFGIRITCAQCHDHPFDRWTMDDYHGLAAFAARMRAKTVGPKDKPIDFELFEADKGDVTMPGSAKIMKPRFLFGGEPPPAMPRMVALAQFTVATGNQQLDKNSVNRVWAWLMGRGFVEPVDDWNDRNKIIERGVLGTVATQFKSHGRSMKFLFRAICSSKYYQRTYTGGGVGAFKSALRPMTGEQLLSSLVTAGRGDKGASYAETSAQWDELREELIPIFGINNEWTEITILPGNTRQVLMMRNSRFVRGLLGGGLLSRLKGKDADKIDTVFRALLTRPATPEEQTRYAAYIRGGGYNAWEDVVWALANSAEFMLRH